MDTGCLREIRLHMWEKKITDRLLTCNTANHSFVNENKLFFNEEGKAKQSRAGTGLTMLVWAHSFLEPQFLRLENGVGTVGLLWLRINEWGQSMPVSDIKERAQRLSASTCPSPLRVPCGPCQEVEGPAPVPMRRNSSLCCVQSYDLLSRAWDDGGLDQGSGSWCSEKWLSSGHILKVGVKRFFFGRSDVLSEKKGGGSQRYHQDFEPEQWEEWDCHKRRSRWRRGWWRLEYQELMFGYVAFVMPIIVSVGQVGMNIWIWSRGERMHWGWYLKPQTKWFAQGNVCVGRKEKISNI